MTADGTSIFICRLCGGYAVTVSRKFKDQRVPLSQRPTAGGRVASKRMVTCGQIPRNPSACDRRRIVAGPWRAEVVHFVPHRLLSPAKAAIASHVAEYAEGGALRGCEIVVETLSDVGGTPVPAHAVTHLGFDDPDGELVDESQDAAYSSVKTVRVVSALRGYTSHIEAYASGAGRENDAHGLTCTPTPASGNFFLRALVKWGEMPRKTPQTCAEKQQPFFSQSARCTRIFCAVAATSHSVGFFWPLGSFAPDAWLFLVIPNSAARPCGVGPLGRALRSFWVGALFARSPLAVFRSPLFGSRGKLSP